MVQKTRITVRKQQKENKSWSRKGSYATSFYLNVLESRCEYVPDQVDDANREAYYDHNQA